MLMTPVHACLTQMSAYDGSLCWIQDNAESRSDALRYAAERLEELRCGAEHMKDRTVRSFHGLLKQHPLRHIDTGIKAFDKQAEKSGGLMPGNVHSNVQTSTYVRPRTQLQCNGQVNPPGHLREFDLKTYHGAAARSGPEHAVPTKILQALDKRPEVNAILYKIFHRNPGAQATTIHGWILTDDQHRHIETARRGEGSPGKWSQPSNDVLAVARAVFCMETVDDRRELLLEIDKGRLVFAASEVLAMADAMHQGRERRGDGQGAAGMAGTERAQEDADLRPRGG